MTSSNDDEAFTPEELAIGIRLFSAIYLLSLALMLVVLGAVVYAGFQGWPWFITIPIGAVSMFGSRVLKRYLRNLLNGLKAEAGGLPAGEEVSSKRRRGPVHFGLQQVTIVAAAMLCVSALWYGIGVTVRLAAA